MGPGGNSEVTGPIDTSNSVGTRTVVNQRNQLSDRPVFLYVAAYDSVEEATEDFAAVIELRI